MSVKPGFDFIEVPGGGGGLVLRNGVPGTEFAAVETFVTLPSGSLPPKIDCGREGGRDDGRAQGRSIDLRRSSTVGTIGAEYRER